MELEGFNISGLGDVITWLIGAPKDIMIFLSKLSYTSFASIPAPVRWVMYVLFIVFIVWLARWCWINRYEWMEVKY